MSLSSQMKIDKILSVIQSGISIYKIDPIAKGSSAKLLLQGKMPTARKIDQMYTNALLLSQQKSADSSTSEQSLSSSNPLSSTSSKDSFYEETLRIQKLRVILDAVNEGMHHNVIDPAGNGGSVRRLLRGGMPTTKKIDQMHANVLAYQKEQLIITKPMLPKVDPDASLDKQQKIDLILQAVQAGIPHAKIDTAGYGKSVRRLLDGKGVLPNTLDLMYANLLQLLGHSLPPDSAEPFVSKKQVASLQQQVSSLQSLLASAFDQIQRLETSVAVLQNQLQPPEKKNTTKILGATILRKTDVIRGKKYPRWYALYLDVNNKRRWIYIGNHLSCAKDKILAWFQRHPSSVRPIHLS